MQQEKFCACFCSSTECVFSFSFGDVLRDSGSKAVDMNLCPCAVLLSKYTLEGFTSKL